MPMLCYAQYQHKLTLHGRSNVIDTSLFSTSTIVSEISGSQESKEWSLLRLTYVSIESKHCTCRAFLKRAKQQATAAKSLIGADANGSTCCNRFKNNPRYKPWALLRPIRIIMHPYSLSDALAPFRKVDTSFRPTYLLPFTSVPSAVPDLSLTSRVWCDGQTIIRVSLIKCIFRWPSGGG